MPLRPFRKASTASSGRLTARQKQIIAEQLICPITLELPFHPVTAEDGQIYERAAIQKHIDGNKRAMKSPMTNEPMGPRLVPSPKIKQLIETLLESGTIVGDLKKAWDVKLQEKKDSEILLKKAEHGDAEAMYTVAGCFFRGESGFENDDLLSYKWLVASHEAHFPPATAWLGLSWLDGEHGSYTVAQRQTEGTLLLGIAAEGGSDMAALSIGEDYAEGQNGLSRCKKKAIYWLQKGLNEACKYKEASEEFRIEFRAKLEELTQAAKESL